ncbi:DUF6017 domain-containing protein [Clostridium sp. BJN0001]|uniref:DUF6017 domain-containing protein n=1 Tax=Clostridium sp. BJN0001 TaxID=2930219 RepID=UPI001FD3FB8D|nr:DUF6017 domain-containing protein [Clostridium sp. BJN0001]
MSNDIDFDYYYGKEAEQFSFYRIPKVLFTDIHFKGLSCEAKVLYGLMLDRMSLSLKNGWLDDNNRVYIYFTLEDIVELMNCGTGKAVKLLAELDGDKGIGLIKRVKQGQGKPTIIYVKSFVIKENAEEKNNESLDFQKSKVKNIQNRKIGLSQMESQDFSKSEVKGSENEKFRVPKSKSQDFSKSKSNYTKYNKTNINDTDNINPIYQDNNNFEIKNIEDRIDEIDNIEIYKEILKENIGYSTLCSQYDKEEVDEIVNLMMDIICSTSKNIRIAGQDLQADIVKSRILKLNILHIQYVINCINKNTTKVRNIKSYMITALYNAPATINHYYKTEVNHDLL